MSMEITYLADISNGASKRNGIDFIIKVPSVEVKKLKEHLSEMVLRDKAAALDLRHELKHADDQTND